MAERTLHPLLPVTVTFDDADTTEADAQAELARILDEADQHGLFEGRVAEVAYGTPRRSTDAGTGDDGAQVCVNCGEAITAAGGTLTGWTHTRSKSDWCNPDLTPDGAHTAAQPR